MESAADNYHNSRASVLVTAASKGIEAAAAFMAISSDAECAAWRPATCRKYLSKVPVRCRSVLPSRSGQASFVSSRPLLHGPSPVK